MKTIANNVDQFVTEVRQQLADLTADEVQSLTENLADDLQERIDEEGATFALGDPVAYAAELRAAAGLGRVAAAPVQRGLVARWLLRAAAKAWDLLKSLKPVWWVLRAFVLHSMLFSNWNSVTIRVLPDSTASWLILIVFVAASVWLGQIRITKVWLKVLAVLINVILILGSLFWFARLYQIRNEYENAMIMLSSEGLVWHGNWVNDLKALDADGNVLSATTFIDQWGNKVFTAPTGQKEQDLNQIVGMTQVEAINWLTVHEYNAVDFRYETVVGVKPGMVTGVAYNLTSNGSEYVVEVTVSSR